MPATIPKISVILPTYGRRHVLPRTIASVFAQDEKDFELIVVDDCSTDDSCAWACKAAAQYSNVKVLRNEVNVGKRKGINAAVRASRAEIIVPAHVLGGIQLIDRGEADDKIIAVVEGDFVWGDARDISAVPQILIERLEHYFATYKLVPGQEQSIKLRGVYGADHAAHVVQAAIDDYLELFPDNRES